MRYLITQPDHEPFFTHHFEADNSFSEGMTVYDLMKGVYSVDGYNWMEITIDHL